MSKNKSNLSKAGILWVRDSEKVVHKEKVTKFVHTYQWKMKLAFIAANTITFGTHAISRVTSLSDVGLEY